MNEQIDKFEKLSYTFDWFSDMLTHLGLFYAKGLRESCSLLIFTFFYVVWITTKGLIFAQSFIKYL